MFRSYLTTAVALTLAVASGACESGSFLGVQEDTQPINITLQSAVTAATAGVTAEVTGPGISQPVVANLPVSNGMASGGLTVLSGSNRVFTLRAFDTQGIETHRGTQTVDIAPDQNMSLSMTLAPLTGDVGLDAQIGTYTINISAPSSTVSVGSTLQHSATVTDVFGADVAGASVTWASMNPGVATVDGSGLVTGVSPGTTDIVVSYKGFAAARTLTVN